VFPFAPMHSNVVGRLHSKISLLPSTFVPLGYDQWGKKQNDHMPNSPNVANNFHGEIASDNHTCDQENMDECNSWIIDQVTETKEQN
jgi:hypothetical protein